MYVNKAPGIRNVFVPARMVLFIEARLGEPFLKCLTVLRFLSHGRLIFIHLQCSGGAAVFDSSAPAVHKVQGP